MDMKLTKRLTLLTLTSTICGLMACGDTVPSFDVENVEGMVPVYASDLLIEQEEPRSIDNPGKILSYGSYLLINDVGAGIHVVNNTDPANPESLFFVSIPENNDLTIYNDVLYADNGADLVGLSFTETGFEEVSRVKYVFAEEGSPGQEYPPQNDVYFECVDQDKGEVVGWIKGTIAKPDCYKSSEL